MQGTARPGGWPSTTMEYNTTAVFTITFYLSLGITSRGRIGINSDLKGMPIVQPWFQDPTDKAVLIRGITEAIAGMEDNCKAHNQSYHAYLTFQFAVPGLVRITPDNSTTLEAFVDAYDKPSMGSNHWVGSTR